MRVFKTKGFARFARKEGLTDKSLAEAVTGIEHGLIDADLGGGLIKQRIARTGEGKSGGFRILLAYRRSRRVIFLFGFAKSDLANIGPEDVRDLKDYGALLLGLEEKDIDLMIKGTELQEIHYGAKHKKIS